MILTQCAVCATELGLSLGKKCGRCSTRYCGPECQVQHWKDGGHDKLCKKIKKAGGAEQYYANKKFAEAVSVAVEKCAEDTKGQTCYICTQALHWKTKEGLVRGCSCRGTAGLAHVSCLVEEAKLLFAEAEENNLDLNAKNPRWMRWCLCSLCDQMYQGVVKCALGWACWKTYLGRPETDQVHGMAMGTLANGLHDAYHYEDALSVREADLAMKHRLGASEHNLLIAQGNLANSYEDLGRHEDALSMRHEVYSGCLNIHGEEHSETLREACNYAVSLIALQRYEEAKLLMRKTMPAARRVLGESHELTLKMRQNYAAALCMDPGATLDDLREAVTMMEESERTARRVYGGAHPRTKSIERALQQSREALSARDGCVSAIREAVAATTLGGAYHT